MRSCGTCTLCCKIMAVTEIAKPRDRWCGHCRKSSGCAIYADRPASCRDFDCLWRQRPEIPEALRPDRCHVVLASSTTGEAVVAHVDPNFPGAARQGGMGMVLDRIVGAGVPVIIACGDRRTLRRRGGPEGSYVEDATSSRVSSPAQ